MLRADLQILENLERGSAEFAPPQVHHNKVPSVANLQRAIFFLFYGDFCLVSVYSRENISSDLNIGWRINKVCGASENEWIPADICGDLSHQEEEELSWWPARAVGAGPWWQQWELLLITEPAFLVLYQ